MTEKTTKDIVSEYYGNRYKKEENELNPFDGVMRKYTIGKEKYIQDLYDQIHPTVASKDYGCGCPIPPQLKGQTVLDLGSGSGRDCFVISKLVGDEGFVIGVDYGEEAIKLSKSFKEYHRKKFGLKKDNIKFIKGDIQDLKSIGIEDNSVDVVISNCVINLAKDKNKVYQEIFRVLKPGGEFFVSDIYSNPEMPKELRTNKFLMSICASGAIYIPKFVDIMSKIGFLEEHIRIVDFKILSEMKDSKEIEEVLKIIEPSLMEETSKSKDDLEELRSALSVVDTLEQPIMLYSITTRIIKKSESKGEKCKNQKVVFKGHDNDQDFFHLDIRNQFEKNVPKLIDSDTHDVLKLTRYNFEFPEFEEEEEEENLQVFESPKFITLINEEVRRKMSDKSELPFFNIFVEEIKKSSHQRMAIITALFLLFHFLGVFGSDLFLIILVVEYVARITVSKGGVTIFFLFWKLITPKLPLLKDESWKRKLENVLFLVLFAIQCFFYYNTSNTSFKILHDLLNLVLLLYFGLEAVAKKSISNIL